MFIFIILPIFLSKINSLRREAIVIFIEKQNLILQKRKFINISQNGKQSVFNLL